MRQRESRQKEHIKKSRHSPHAWAQLLSYNGAKVIPWEFISSPRVIRHKKINKLVINHLNLNLIPVSTSKHKTYLKIEKKIFSMRIECRILRLEIKNQISWSKNGYNELKIKFLHKEILLEDKNTIYKVNEQVCNPHTKD